MHRTADAEGVSRAVRRASSAAVLYSRLRFNGSTKGPPVAQAQGSGLSLRLIQKPGRHVFAAHQKSGAAVDELVPELNPRRAGGIPEPKLWVLISDMNRRLMNHARHANNITH
jgi:hypothetical protein